jgi:hypothetical protein
LTSNTKFKIGFFKLTGRIPWGDIADNPSDHLSKRSCPDTDHKLMDPSHMKAKGVDNWLKHWAKLQQKGKRPLTFKDPSDPQPNNARRPSKKSKGKGKQRAKHSDSESEESSGNSDDANTDAGKKVGKIPKGKGVSGNATTEEGVNSGQTSRSGEVSAETDRNDNAVNDNAPGLPPAPCSAGKSKDYRRTFLESLSDDKNYRLLIKLLAVAKVRASTPF